MVIKLNLFFYATLFHLESFLALEKREHYKFNDGPQVAFSQSGTSKKKHGDLFGNNNDLSKYFEQLKKGNFDLKAQWCQKFEDNFNSLDFSTWKHDITMAGGGNNEFQLYQNNRTNSFIKNGTLYLYPTFTANNPDEVTHMLNDMEVNLYGTDPPADCTSNAFGGCWKKSDPNSGAMVNPIRSAAIRSIDSFTIKYGKIETRARMPSGDWLWPAIWLLPKYQAYGTWPSSGEIDLLESKGNLPENYHGGEGNNVVRSSLHWGTDWTRSNYDKTSASVKIPKKGDHHKLAKRLSHPLLKNGTNGENNDFHTYSLEWTPWSIKTFVDNEPILEICFFGDKAYETTWRDALKPNPPHDWYKPSKSFFDKGEYPSTTVNPWSGEQASFEPAAPFDQEFYLIMNLAVGGNGGYFPDGVGNKPWKNFGSPGQASRDFWKAKDSNWGHTWKEDLSRAFAIDYVKVYDLC